MNPEALPTPYDIVGIPYFPYAPTLRDWLLLTIVSLVIILFIRLRSLPQLMLRGGIPKVQHYALARCQKWQQELTQSSTHTAADLQSIAFELSLLLRRVVEFHWKVPASGMTAKELQLLFPSESSPAEYQQWIALLSAIENTKFQNAPTTIAQIDTVVREAIVLLHEPTVKDDSHA